MTTYFIIHFCCISVFLVLHTFESKRLSLGDLLLSILLGPLMLIFMSFFYLDIYKDKVIFKIKGK